MCRKYNLEDAEDFCKQHGVDPYDTIGFSNDDGCQLSGFYDISGLLCQFHEEQMAKYLAEYPKTEDDCCEDNAHESWTDAYGNWFGKDDIESLKRFYNRGVDIYLEKVEDDKECCCNENMSKEDEDLFRIMEKGTDRYIYTNDQWKLYLKDNEGRMWIDGVIQNTTKKEKNLYMITYHNDDDRIVKYDPLLATEYFEYIIASSSDKAVKKFNELHYEKIIVVELISENIIR